MNSFNCDNLLQELVNNIANKQCFDCNEFDNTWTSLNNGIFLCIKCSQIHRGFGEKISQVRSIETDQWTEYHLNFLKFGGNQAFKEYLLNYDFPQEVTQQQKYRSVATVFYRKKLKQKVDNDDLIWIEEQPTKEEGIKILDQFYFNEASQDLLQCKEIVQEPIIQRKESDELGKIKNFFANTFSKAEQGVKDVTKKIEETNFKQEFKDLGTKIQTKSTQLSGSISENLKIAKEKSIIAAEKTKGAASETFSGLSEKSKTTMLKAKEVTSEGFDTLKKNIGSAWGIFKNKVTSKKENQTQPQVNGTGQTCDTDDKLSMDEKYEIQ